MTIFVAIIFFSLNFIETSMQKIDELSLLELQNLIKEAQSTLEQKQHAMRKEVVAQIKELAASIDVTVQIIDDKTSKRSTSEVVAKYQNPQNPLEQWTGRGLPPKWMKALIEAGHAKEDFLINR